MPPPEWLGNCWHQSHRRFVRESATSAFVAGLSWTRSRRELTTQPSAVAPGPLGLAGQTSFQTGATPPSGASYT